jgi:hypothetical protein
MEGYGEKYFLALHLLQYFLTCFLPLLTLKFNTVRPGTMYIENKTLVPVERVSNGTVIAVGNVAQNEDFYNYGNNLNSFLLKDKKIRFFIRIIAFQEFFMRLDFIDLKGQMHLSVR